MHFKNKRCATIGFDLKMRLNGLFTRHCICQLLPREWLGQTVACLAGVTGKGKGSENSGEKMEDWGLGHSTFV